MQVIFIHHSCFLVEVDEKVLIFDWFAGDRVNGYTFRGQIPEYVSPGLCVCKPQTQRSF